MSEQEDNQSPEERMEWLRKRGVQIELPEDRVSQPTDMANLKYITVVKIPCNDSEPYSEIKVGIDVTKPGDRLMESLREYFTPATDGIDEKLIKETASKQFAMSGEQNLPPIDISSIRKTAGSLGSG